MSKTNHYSMGFLHNQTNTEKGFWSISYFFIGNRMNLSVVFIIFLKEVCKVHTLFVVFFNILHKTVRYEVLSCKLGQYGTAMVGTWWYWFSMRRRGHWSPTHHSQTLKDSATQLHTWYLSFFLHGQNFWRIKLYTEIYTVNCQFTQ